MWIVQIIQLVASLYKRRNFFFFFSICRVRSDHLNTDTSGDLVDLWSRQLVTWELNDVCCEARSLRLKIKELCGLKNMFGIRPLRVFFFFFISCQDNKNMVCSRLQALDQGAQNPRGVNYIIPAIVCLLWAAHYCLLCQQWPNLIRLKTWKWLFCRLMCKCNSFISKKGTWM